MILQRYPMFRIFLFYCTGILLSYFFSLSGRWVAYSLVTLLILSLLTGWLSTIFSRRSRRFLFGSFINLSFLCLGILLLNRHSQPADLQTMLNDADYYRITLLEHPREKTRSLGAEARIEIPTDGRWQQAGLMLYLQKSVAARKLGYGDIIYCQRSPQAIKPPANPYEFDYRKFLSLKGIHYQLYLDSSGFVSRGEKSPAGLIAYSKRLRQQLIHEIEGWPLSSKEAAVSKALLLGYRYDIDDEQMQAYAAAGAMHVLAVSGLHVGIVYLMAAQALFFLKRLRHGELIRSLILVLLLWVFAAVTGLSASVTRAATMFSLVAIGSGFSRHTSVYNTILASAFLLLLIKPGFLLEVGFQLSYAAVLGIVWLQPKLDALWQPPGWVLQKCWAITTVSIAAQLATFPLAVYYFHQFPGLFLLSNLIVIPLVSLLMYVGMVSLILSSLHLIPDLALRVYDLLLKAMNGSVSWIEEQSQFVLDGLHIEGSELILIYLSILAFLTWLWQGGLAKLRLALSSLLLLSLLQWQQVWQRQQTVKLLMYQLPDQAAVALYTPAEDQFWSSTGSDSTHGNLQYHIQPHWWALNSAPKIAPLKHPSTPQLVQLDEERICLLDSERPPIKNTHTWLVTANCYPQQHWQQHPKLVVIGDVLGYAQRRAWQKWCQKNDISIHLTARDGAFERSISLR